MPLRLQDVCELIIDCEHKTAPTQPTGYPSIRTPNIGRGFFNLDDVNRVSEDIYRAWTKRAVPQVGDIVMAREAPVGNVAMIPEGLQVCLGQRTLLIRPSRKKVIPRFLAYLLLGPDAQTAIHALTNGATVPHLNMADIRQLPLPNLPPLDQQEYLAKLIGAYDDLVHNNLRRIRLLEEIARTIYREWFVNFRFPGHEGVGMIASSLGPIPKGCEVVSFTDLADVLSGGTPKTDVPEYWDGGIPFFTPRDAPRSYYAHSTEKHVTDLGVSKCASELYPRDTVFITARGTVGKVALAGVPMAMNQSCYALSGKDGLPNRLLFQMVLDQVDYLRTNSGGATFSTIVVDTFRRMRVVRPPAALIKRYTSVANPIFELLDVLLRQVTNLRTTRDLLLPRLMSGRLSLAEAGRLV